ncbi:hypothetical protein PtB15_17B220 [Puccinia triticina]|nr:hypothetical protein PtB15_17B220 [Puccinia triticina]
MPIVQTTNQIKHTPPLSSHTPPGLLPDPPPHLLQSALIHSANPPHPVTIPHKSILQPVCNSINPNNQPYSCVDRSLLGYPLIMWNVDPSTNKQQNNSGSPSAVTTAFQSLPKSMLPGAQSVNPETSSTPSHQSKPNSRSAHPPSSHPPSIHHPTIIRSLTRRFSPPFKPFGSKEPDTDEDSIVPLDSPINIPSSMLSSDLSSNRFRNHPNAEVIVLSATQPASRAMKASGSKPKHCESKFTTPGANQPDSPGDEVLRSFVYDSDMEMQDAPSLKRPRRKGDKSNRQKNPKPCSASQSSISDPTISSNIPQAVTFAQSPKPSRSNTRSTQPSASTSRNLLKQPSDDDEDVEMAVAPKSKLLTNGNGRAATARRALLNTGASGLVWSGGEQPSEPIPSSSTAIIASPRLPPARRPSPSDPASPTNLCGSSSSTHGEPEDEQPGVPSHESPPDIKPVKKSKTKSDPNSSRVKRPKPPSPIDPPTAPDTPAAPADGSCKVEVKRRIAALLPATEPDEYGQYESSTCHQCRVKTTRPKMICDQSQDPNCVVRVCHTCLMVRTVYADMPELRPPIFQFVPGGTMLCVKCRDICPCASCRRRRGEKEQCRRGLGSALKGFYGLTPEEREQALLRKKEKQEAARQKKEARPPSEKKAPSTAFRREVASIRGAYDDDEHGRLEHWAPLPVFPPLPKRRKKKRKRLELIEGARLDSQASDTDSDSSCSDSDSNDETDSDAQSLSSVSSFRSGARARLVLGPESFQLPLSSNTRNTLPLLTKSWRTNLSRSLKAEHSSFRKPRGHKAPVVWIKNGAMVQARKPPTTEFMQRLAQEQKGRSGSDPNLPADQPSISHPNPVPSSINQTNPLYGSIDASQLDDLDKMDISRPNYPDPTSPNGFQSSSKLNGNSAGCTCTMEHLQSSIEALDNPLVPHTEKCPLFGSDRYPQPMPMSDHLGMCSGNLNPTPPPIMEGGAVHGEFGGEMDMERFRALRTTTGDGFEPGSSPIDHQTYLASLTDEQLSAVLKEGHNEMIKQGLLPSSLNPNGMIPSKFTSQFSTGISPELISAALPLRAEHEQGSSGTEEDMAGEQGATTSSGAPGAAATSGGPGLKELTEEDQEAGLIEAANWAAVWGATDGAGGFLVTKPKTHPDEDPETTMEQQQRQDDFPANPPLNLHHPATTNLPFQDSSVFDNWVHHAAGTDKELFLRAMKSRVGDEWLTDVMPLDSC